MRQSSGRPDFNVGIIVIPILLFRGPTVSAQVPGSDAGSFIRPAPISMAELAKLRSGGVSAVEISDYDCCGYAGEFPAPPHADGNPRKAFVVVWKDLPQRLVFSHEASYCPWIELPSGAAASFQFWEGNDGWAELFNQWGRQERNSFVDVPEAGPERVRIRWTYFGVNQESGRPAYRATEDFWAFPNGLILRRQAYRTLRPGKHEGYAREPIELIGIVPAGKGWADVLRRGPEAGERHALAVLDPFSENRYDVWWTPTPGRTPWESTHRRAGCAWKALDDAAGVAMILPLAGGAPFVVFGDASGFPHDGTRIKEHTFPDTGGLGWGSSTWDHWPVGWLNSQGHPVDAASAGKFPGHFSPAGMDFFALPDETVERMECWSLMGVGGEAGDGEDVRSTARKWLEAGVKGVTNPDEVAKFVGFKK